MTQPPASHPYHEAPLRIGLFLDALTLPKWAFDIATHISNSSIAEIAVLVINGSSSQANNRRYFLYNKYMDFDQRQFGQHPDVFQDADLNTLLPDCPIIRVEPESKAATDTFSQADVDKICAYNLDVAIQLGFQSIQGKALETARYGIWSYQPAALQGNPAGFWEMMNRDPVIHTDIEMYSPEYPNGRVIYQAFTGATYYSVVRTLNRPFMRYAAITVHKLNGLYEQGPSALEIVINDNERVANYKHRRIPGNLQMLTLLPKIISRFIQKRREKTGNEDHWQIAYYLGDEQQPLENTFTKHKFIEPPTGHFWADPFVVKKDDKYYIFIEDFPYQLDRGILSVLEMDKHGNYGESRPILEKDYHLSYPFIFEWDNEYHMIPETHENGTIDLYRCVSFPDQWELVKTLVDGVVAADATLLEYNGKWWMFATIGSESMNEELHIFYADSPIGEWQPHKQNPVKSDIRSARPAGHIIKRGDTYYRPAQDCSVRYGYAIVIHKIVQLDTESYIEEQVSKILPHGFERIAATHTINYTEGISVIDGDIMVPK